MTDLILVNAQHRTLQALYGNPPAGVVPTCTPGRGAQTVDEWYAEQEAPAYQPEQLTEQPQRYTVQEQLRRQRQIADSSGVSETTTNDGIYWFTVSEDSEVSK